MYPDSEQTTTQTLIVGVAPHKTYVSFSSVDKCELGDLCPILAVRSAIQRSGSHFGNECLPRAVHWRDDRRMVEQTAQIVHNTHVVHRSTTRI